MKRLFALFACAPVVAMAMPDMPIEPAHAADQAVVTSKSLREELDQYRAMSDWQKAQDEYEIGKKKLAQSKTDLEHAQTLRRNGAITEAALAETFINTEVLEGEVTRLQHEVQKAKSTSLFHKMRVIEEGNPGQDYRAQVSQVIVDGLHDELQSLKRLLEVARTANILVQKHLDNGKLLFAKNGLTKLELDRRTLATENAANKVQSVDHQVKMAEAALAAFENNQNML